MSQQLALSSIFSVLALASLCLAVGSGQMVGATSESTVLVGQPFSSQVEISSILGN